VEFDIVGNLYQNFSLLLQTLATPSSLGYTEKEINFNEVLF